MNKEQWHKAYHLARLSTCINRQACVDEEAEVKAYRELHELIQSGFMTRKDFWAAQDCVHFYRYPHDKLDTFQNRFKGLRHQMFAYGNRSNECR
tara:strand:- start:84 stop:365 length:282 start_codon:yes stop_codon:yes gene_type:complete